ncbi:MAG: hypothetical protein ACMG51_10710 [Ginsengibacter sp.]
MKKKMKPVDPSIGFCGSKDGTIDHAQDGMIKTNGSWQQAHGLMTTLVPCRSTVTCVIRSQRQAAKYSFEY